MDLSILYVLYFYLVTILFAFLCFPLTFYLFKSLNDRGYAFARLLAILLITFVVWFLSSTIKFPYSFLSIFLTSSFLLVLSIAIILKKRKEILNFVKKNRKIIIIEETLFGLFFLFFILVRFGNPDLWHPSMGGEKPMDLAFINALVRTSQMPPYDPWLAGETINYYYFGQFITATLIKLLNIPASFFYNIFLAYLFAQSAVGIYSLTQTFTNLKKSSLLGPLLLLGIGNLGQIPIIIQSFSTPIPINGWYWTATRIMPNSEINEFPFFTFLYADLHSHMIALPIALLFIGLCYQAYKTRAVLRILFFPILLGLILGLLRFTNIWDFPTYLLFFFTIMTVRFLFGTKKTIGVALKNLVFFVVAVVSSFVLIYPFIATYKTGSLGIGFYDGPETLVSDYLIIHGLFIFILTCYTLASSYKLNLVKVARVKRLVFLLPLALLSFSIINHLYFIAFLSLVFFLALIPFMLKSLDEKDRFMLAAFIFAIFLTALPDILDIKVGLGRMNTVFKFYFQAWILFAVSSSYLAIKTLALLSKSKKLLYIYTTCLVVLVSLCFTYIPTATYAKVEDRMAKNVLPTLDGEKFMLNSVYFDKDRAFSLLPDYNAIQWLKNNIKGEHVILEATTPIYRWGSRISVYTGLPTVLGWDWHEIAHRQFQPSTFANNRQYDIQAIYESSDIEQTKTLLDKYNVKYIYIGYLEKIYYDTSGIESLIEENPHIFEVIYLETDVVIYSFNQ